MRPFNRADSPDFLQKNSKKWGENYAKQKTKNPTHTFQWKTFEKQKVNHLLLPTLKTQTQHHCSYCDFFPPRVADQTIDHFQPKGNSLYYLFVYKWTNLYFSCSNCQSIKMENYDPILLRPDALDYSFERYFILNFSTFEIKPNPKAISEDQNRAELSIRLFGFNETGQLIARRHSFERYNTTPSPDLEDFAFRFIFE
jgi:uncharacterized protein (TIGR02646 family)